MAVRKDQQRRNQTQLDKQGNKPHQKKKHKKNNNKKKKGGGGGGAKRKKIKERQKKRKLKERKKERTKERTKERKKARTLLSTRRNRQEGTRHVRIICLTFLHPFVSCTSESDSQIKLRNYGFMALIRAERVSVGV